MGKKLVIAMGDADQTSLLINEMRKKVLPHCQKVYNPDREKKYDDSDFIREIDSIMSIDIEDTTSYLLITNVRRMDQLDSIIKGLNALSRRYLVIAFTLNQVIANDAVDYLNNINHGTFYQVPGIIPYKIPLLNKEFEFKMAS